MFEGFNRGFVRNAISSATRSPMDRRRFLRAAGLTGLGAVGVAGVAGGGMVASTPVAVAQEGPSDVAVLNFALNLEYLEAEFYLRSVTGTGLGDDLVDGTGTPGGVTGGRQVRFDTPLVRQYAEEIAADEREHVRFLRDTLGSAKVARPAIDIDAAFSAAASAAGLVSGSERFDPYANENNFLLAAFVFEDVGVTAYKGAAPLISNKTYLEAAAGILAVEAYHAASIRATLLARGLEVPAGTISDARDSLDGPADLDQGIVTGGAANIVPADSRGIAFSRDAGQVLNVVYLNPGEVRGGGFFPAGVNGEIVTSSAGG